MVNKFNLMKKEQIKDNVVKSTESGRLYIKTEDFFKQTKVQDAVHKLVDSDLYRRIVRKGGRLAAK